VSRLLKDDGFRSRLIGATDPAEIYKLIKEEDAKY
jgi:mannitol/fructose-specific phosphotransferase system IIA component (Ntr-type)